MVHFCCVPGCSNRSDRESHLSFHRLPLKRKHILKQWIHKIGRKNLPLKESMRVCSDHFPDSRGRILRSDEVPSLNLPSLPTRVSIPTPRRTLIRHTPTTGDLDESISQAETTDDEHITSSYSDVAINTELTMADIDLLETKLKETEKDLNPFTHGREYTRARIPLMNAWKRVYSRLQLFLFTNKSACYLLMTEWKTAPMV